MEGVILSDGEKLKAIRQKYGLRQDEISGEDITRNLISEIETNKANITKKTAEIIIKNLKEIAKKKKLKITETVEYLMENQIVQATKILDNYIEELKTLVISKDGSFIEILKKAENFLIDWDIKDKKLSVYEIAGDYYCSNNDMYTSAIYYEKASALLSKMFLDKSLLTLSRKLSMVYTYIGNYKKSIECCDFALSRFPDMSQKDKVVFMYNNALNYFGIKNFEKSLNNLKIAENLIDKNNTMYIKILNNKASCLYEMKLYNEALQVFTEILNLTNTDDLESYLVILTNIVDVYMDINMKDKAIKNLNSIIDALPNLDNDSLCASNIHFDIGNIFKRLDKLDSAEDYYLKALNLSEKQKNYVLANEILNTLADMYISVNNVKKMNDIKEKVFFIAIKKDKLDNTLIYKLIKFYDKIGGGICTEIADFALRFN